MMRLVIKLSIMLAAVVGGAAGWPRECHTTV